MRKSHAVAAAALLALAVAAPARSETWVIDKNHSEAGFRIRHFVSQVSGRFDDFAGEIQVDHENPAASNVRFTIQATSINTGNERRDNHLRSADFFDVEKFPEITFSSSRVEPRGDNVFHVTGTLTMHGVSKEITLPVEFLGSVTDNRGNTKAGFETEIQLDRKEYGLLWNQTLDQGGVMLGDDVRIRIALEVSPPREPATN